MVTPPPSTPASARGSRTPPASRKPPGGKQPQQRSTCDACQDAKIRCSHDKPRCRRCTSQNLSCVYSVSRRMGRPRRLKSPGPTPAKPRQGQTRPESSQSSEDANVVSTASVVAVAERPETRAAAMTDVSAHISPLQTSTAPGWASAETTETSVNPFDGALDWSDSLDLNGSTAKVYDDGFLLPPCISDFEYNISADFPDNPTTTTATEALSEAHRVRSGRTPKTASTDSELSPTNATVLISPDHAHLEPFGVNAQRPRGQVNSTSIATAPSSLDFFALGPTKSSCSCHCYDSVIRGLTGLDDTQSDIPSSTIDVVMSLENSVAMHTAKVLSCEACLGSRPSLLLLLVVIIDNMVCMLENTTSLKNKPHKRIAFRRNNFSCLSSSRGANRQKDDRSLTASHSCALLVGGYEILGEARMDFLKQLVQGRLSRLCSTLHQVRYHMQQNPQNSNSKAGTIMITDINRRLQLLIGRVELWVG